jgi:hypothetical protein
MKRGFCLLLILGMSGSAIAADFGLAAGLGAGYANWDGWGGGSVLATGGPMLELNSQGSGTSMSADVLLGWTTVRSNGNAMSFWTVGTLAKLRFGPVQIGAGYGYIPGFTDELGGSYPGTGSLLFSAGLVFPIRLSRQVSLGLGAENVFITRLASFYNPSAKVALTFSSNRHKAAEVPAPPPVTKPGQIAVKQPTGAQAGKPAFAPKLEVSPSFVEMGKKNSALDAGEQAYIVVAVANRGRGEASDLRVKAEAISSMSGIVIGPEQRIVRLASGASDTVRVRLKAADDMKDQEVRFRVSVIESTFGADAPPSAITITARRFEPPELYVYDKAITDDPKKTDYTDGNGDGQWQTSEQVEVTFAIQNKGTGPAEGAQVEVVTTDPNVMLMGGKNTFSLGDVAAGDYRMVKCPVYVNTRFQGSQIELVLSIQDQRPRFAWSDTVTIPLNQQVKEASEVVVAPKATGAAPVAITPPSLTDSLMVGVPKGGSNPDAIAVVIGVSDYRDVTKVEYAQQDAAAMRKYLIEAFGYQDGNVWALDDPSKADLERTFGTAGDPKGQLLNTVSWKPGRCDVFVYYAGHGAPSIKEKKGYLVPADASPDYIEINGYPLDVFYANLGKVPARSLTIVVDACFSGETPDIAGKVSTFLRDASPLTIKPFTEELPPNATVMTAASGSQIASWYPDKRHSLFTYYLLKGLKGEADGNQDKAVTLSELDSYVRSRVPPVARAVYNREQVPEMRGNANAEVLKIR